MSADTALPFDNFECDKCGACCQTLIVEAHHYDARREPRLYQLPDVDKEKVYAAEHPIVLWDSEKRSCPFLCSETKHCGIYSTRPVECVMVEPGDAKCQQARRMKNLGLLHDKDGNPPSRRLLLESCMDYDLAIEDVLGDDSA